MNSSRNPYPAGSALDQLYQKYHDAGFSPAYILQYFAPQACCAIVSMLMNFSLVWVTIKCRSSLNSAFSIFMAFESFSGFLYSQGYFLGFCVVALTGQNVVTYPTCILARFTTAWGVFAQFGMMLFISLERLLCLLFPLWYKNGRTNIVKCYIFIAILLCILYGSFMQYVMLRGAPPDWAGKDYLCNFNDYYGASAKAVMYQAGIYTQIPTLCIYGLIWLMMLKAMIMRVQLTNTYNMHILKSLTVIMSFILAGFVLNGVSPYFIPLLGLSPLDSLMPPIVFTCMTICTTGANGPILYIFSSQYRKCYKEVFKWLKKDQHTWATIQVAPATAMSRTMLNLNTV